jgi:hypothetical protein
MPIKPSISIDRLVGSGTAAAIAIDDPGMLTEYKKGVLGAIPLVITVVVLPKSQLVDV